MTTLGQGSDPQRVDLEVLSAAHDSRVAFANHHARQLAEAREKSEMNTATALARQGCRMCCEPGDRGYADSGGRVRPCGPIRTRRGDRRARSPTDVSSAIAVVAERGETLTVLGAGHGRLQGLQGGVAITLRHLDTVEVDVTERTRPGRCRLDLGTGPGGDRPSWSGPAVRVGAGCRRGRLSPRRRTRSSCELRGVQQRPCPFLRHRDARRTVSITASEDDHSDLFWALRGGKGGFGVVTSVTIDLLEMTHVYGGGVYFAAEDAPAVLSAYADWAPSLPGSSTTSIALLRLPPVAVLPDAIRGRHVVHVRFASLESSAAARAQIDDIRGVAQPVLDTVRDLPYGQLGTIHGDPRDPMR